jgi:hypothetical protein
LRTGLAAGVPYRYFSCVEVLTTVIAVHSRTTPVP